MIGVDAVSFLVIVSAAAVAALISALVSPRLLLPVVVVELLLGIVDRPAGRATSRGRPRDEVLLEPRAGDALLLRRATRSTSSASRAGRSCSGRRDGCSRSGIAYGLAGILVRRQRGRLRPVHGHGHGDDRDRDVDPDPPRQRRASDALRHASCSEPGAMGEFGPILLVTVVLTYDAPAARGLDPRPLHRPGGLHRHRGRALHDHGLGSAGAHIRERRASSAVRVAVVLVFGLVALATQLGLDLLLGGFVAGMITRLALRGREVAIFESKLTAIGYGFLIPFFFVVSGMAFDVEGLVTSPWSACRSCRSSWPSSSSSAAYPRCFSTAASLGLRDRVALGVLLRDRASARRRHHDAGSRARRHARDNRVRARRRRDHLDARLPADRPTAAAGTRRGARRRILGAR